MATREDFLALTGVAAPEPIPEHVYVVKIDGAKWVRSSHVAFLIRLFAFAGLATGLLLGVIAGLVLAVL